VVNPWSVTSRADLSDRQIIRRAARVSPEATLVVTGCWAQTSPGDVAAMEEVDLVVGNGDKHRLPELLDRIGAERVHVSDIGEVRAVEVTPAARLSGRSRAFRRSRTVASIAARSVLYRWRAAPVGASSRRPSSSRPVISSR